MTIILLGIALSFLFAGDSVNGQTPCEDCLRASQEELKHCLDNALSQEDKISCGDKQDAQAKVCEHSECKTEREGRKQGDVAPEKKQNPERTGQQ